jgi:hypothetical protein
MTWKEFFVLFGLAAAAGFALEFAKLGTSTTLKIMES